MKSCVKCGEEFAPTHGNQTRCFLCGHADRESSKRGYRYVRKTAVVACAACGGEFQQVHGREKSCRPCRARWVEERAARVAARRATRPSFVRCAVCLDWTKNAEFCSIGCKNRGMAFRPTVCRSCGWPFTRTSRGEFARVATECWDCRSAHFVPGGASWRGIKTYRKKQLVARAGSRCEDCGTDEGPFHAHHIVPQSMGGTHALGNLKLLCEDCHSGSGWARNHSALVWAGLVVPPRGAQLEIA